jgi:NADPH:quinone reductase-like Zn-dependent oxidoreductase
MKAINYEKYGSSSVLKLSDIKKPEPKDSTVLIIIHSIALNAPNWRLLRGPPFITWLMFSLIKPKYQIIGIDM